jgi:hypothetical protein
MVHAAHASRYHWGIAGTLKNQARGDWQIARVHATLDHFCEAERYANLYLAACKNNVIEDWDLPFAFEGLARACVKTKPKKAKQYLAEARQTSEKIVKEKDKKWLLANLDEIVSMLDAE